MAATSGAITHEATTVWVRVHETHTPRARHALRCCRPVACRLRVPGRQRRGLRQDLHSGILPLHHCYTQHMEASRSMRLFKLAYDPVTRGQASRLARQPAPQYLSRIYSRSRLILFLHQLSMHTWTRNWNRRRFCVFRGP